MWVFFLNTDVLRLPSSSGVMRMSRKAIDPSSLVFFTGESYVGMYGVKMFQEAIFVVFLDDGKCVIYISFP